MELCPVVMRKVLRRAYSCTAILSFSTFLNINKCQHVNICLHLHRILCIDIDYSSCHIFIYTLIVVLQVIFTAAEKLNINRKCPIQE